MCSFFCSRTPSLSWVSYFLLLALARRRAHPRARALRRTALARSPLARLVWCLFAYLRRSPYPPSPFLALFPPSPFPVGSRLHSAGLPIPAPVLVSPPCSPLYCRICMRDRGTGYRILAGLHLSAQPRACLTASPTRSALRRRFAS